MNWQNADPSPRLLVLPPGAVSLDEAHAAVKQWEHYSGKTLDTSQRLAVQVMMAEDAGGRWAARTTGREMPRQNGKGDELEVVEFWGLTQRAEAILHSAHELITVSSAHERMSNLLGHRDLRRKVRKVLNGLGQQMIEMTNGGVIVYRTRTNGGGRGLDDISRLVIDEAQHAKPEQLAAATPTLLANPNPQTNFAGTGAIEGVSAWWWQVRKRALSADPGQFGYVGHTAETLEVDGSGNVRQFGVDPEDRALWYLANPALCAGRGDIGFFEEQLRILGPALFAREHLGVWDPEPTVANAGPIDLDVWASLVDRTSMPVAATCRLGMDCNLDRSWFSLCLAGERADGLVHGEITKAFPSKDDAVAAAVSAAAALSRPVTVSEASALADDLVRAGCEVDVMKPGEQALATARLIDATKGEAPLLRHRGEPALVRALELAVTKPYGDGGRVWSRRTTDGDISPLTALTMAIGRLGDGAGGPSVYETRGMAVV